MSLPGGLSGSDCAGWSSATTQETNPHASASGAPRCIDEPVPESPPRLPVFHSSAGPCPNSLFPLFLCFRGLQPGGPRIRPASLPSAPGSSKFVKSWHTHSPCPSLVLASGRGGAARGPTGESHRRCRARAPAHTARRGLAAPRSRSPAPSSSGAGPGRIRAHPSTQRRGILALSTPMGSPSLPNRWSTTRQSGRRQLGGTGRERMSG